MLLELVLNHKLIRAAGKISIDNSAAYRVISVYRAVATISQKHVTKHFRVAKRTLCSMAAERKLL